jgi:hypothetical protein
MRGTPAARSAKFHGFRLARNLLRATSPTDDAPQPGTPGGERGWQPMADMFKCPKCGKTSPKFTNCCGTPMKKNG